MKLCLKCLNPKDGWQFEYPAFVKRCHCEICVSKTGCVDKIYPPKKNSFWNPDRSMRRLGE